MFGTTLTKLRLPLTLPLLFVVALAACDDGVQPSSPPKTVWETSFVKADGPIRDLWFTGWWLGYAVGRSEIYKWDGWVWNVYGDFGAAHPGWTADFAAVAAPAADDVWVVGTAADGARNYRVLHYDGQTWEPVTVAGLTAARDVYFLAPDDGWIAGNGLFHYDGERWERTATASVDHLSFTGPEEGFACSATELYRWDGTTWARQTLDLAAGETLNGVASRVGSGALAVGGSGTEAGGLVLQFNGGGWNRITPPDAGVSAADMLDFQEVWAGGLGASWYYDGESFKRFALPSKTLRLRTVLMVDREHIWACGGEEPGNRGFILRFGGFP